MDFVENNSFLELNNSGASCTLLFDQPLEAHTVFIGRLFVPLADKLDNATSPVRDLEIHGAIVLQRFNKKPQQILWYYKSLYKVLNKTFSKKPKLARHLETQINSMKKFYKNQNIKEYKYTLSCTLAPTEHSEMYEVLTQKI